MLWLKQEQIKQKGQSPPDKEDQWSDRWADCSDEESPHLIGGCKQSISSDEGSTQ